MLFLQDFDLVFWVTPGSQMGPGNALSHKDEIDTSHDNQDIVLLPPILFIKAINIALASKIAHSFLSNLLVFVVLHILDDGKSLFAKAFKHD